MATFRDSTASGAFVGATVTPSRPTLTQQGDLQLMFIVIDGTGDTGGPPTGGGTWVQVGSFQNVVNGDTATFSLWAQVAGASEPSTYSFSPSASHNASNIAIGIAAYYGVDVSGGALAALSAQLATNPNLASPPTSPVSIAASAITTTAANQTVVWFGMVDWNSATAAAFTDPASTTRRAIANGAGFSNLLITDFVQGSAGSTGTITGTGTLAAATGNFGAWMVALKDAPSGSAPAPLPALVRALRSANGLLAMGLTSPAPIPFVVNPLVVNATPGAWSWTGTTALTSQLLNATPGAWSWVGLTATTTQLLNAAPGAWSWAGSTALTSQLLNAAPGTWSWAGTTATTSQLINSDGGATAWSWAGTTATLGAGAVNATPGTWSWAGITAAITQLINGSVGAWSWTGSTATTSQLLNATPGTWSWAGTTATTNPVIAAAPGTWSWVGSTALTSQLINAAPATWSWAGTTATTNPVIAATPGLWSWVGTTATTSKLMNAIKGAWSWAGTTASIGNGSAVFPLPSQVLAGVQYGPTGNDYTGTMSPGGAFLRRR